jgi:Glutaminase
MRAMFLAFGIFCVGAFAADTTITTTIHDIDYGRDQSEEVLVFLSSGHVTKMGRDNKSFMKLIAMAKGGKQLLDVNWDKDRYITSLRRSEKKVTPVDPKSFAPLSTESTYVPTTVADIKTAQNYHAEGRRTTKEETQCFNRAMIWTFEWWKNHSLKSNKILIFFTRNYIRRYNFEWWFHIAPYLHVMDNGKVVERAMDLKYTSRPLTFKQWTDVFMQKDPVCPFITKYSDYADHPYEGECYLYRTNMYTYQPADLEMLEAWGYKKDRWNYDEIRGAYLEAFDISY